MAIFRTIPTGDIALEGGSFAFIAGVDFYRQKISSRFKFFLAEWFLDLRQGVPYHRDVLKKGPDLSVVTSVFRRVLLKTKGVILVKRFAVQFDATARHLSFDFEALTEAGPVIVAPEDRDFILDT